jgi:hypothetical protein
MELIKNIEDLAIEYRKYWKEGLWESKDIEEFGLNEFIGGKAEAYEDCVQIIKQDFQPIIRLSEETIEDNLQDIAQVFSTSEGVGIDYLDITRWMTAADELSLVQMSNNIIELMGFRFDFDEEESCQIAEKIVLEIKKV